MNSFHWIQVSYRYILHAENFTLAGNYRPCHIHTFVLSWYHKFQGDDTESKSIKEVNLYSICLMIFEQHLMIVKHMASSSNINTTNKDRMSEQVIEVEWLILWFVFGRFRATNLAWEDSAVKEVFRDLFQSSNASAGIVSHIGHGLIPQIPSQFIIYLLFSHSTLPKSSNKFVIK